MPRSSAPRHRSNGLRGNQAAVRVQQTLSRAVALHQAGQLAQAKARYEEVLAAQPRNFDALHLSGLVACQLHDARLAAERIAKAIAIKADYAPAHHHLGIALAELGQYESAVKSYDTAIALGADNAKAHNDRGNALWDLGQLESALRSYDTAIALQPDFAEAHYNRGSVLAGLRQTRAALQCFDRAIALRPAYALAWNNRGVALHELGSTEAALQSFDTAIAADARLVDAINNRAFALADLKQYSAALQSFDRVLALRPDYPFVFGARLRARMQICDWTDIEADVAQLVARLQRGEMAARPFDVQAIIGSPELQASAAQTWMRARCPDRELLPRPWPYPRHERIRVGYFSADFRNHAVSILTAQLFEKHDRSRFELYGFSYGPDTGDELRGRVAAAFEHFIDVRDMSDRGVAELARASELDIAVDLGGFTQHARTGIFAMRAAPVQTSYLGYLGTMGADYIDYLIADETTVPEAQSKHYAEKIVRLPSYQVNDSQRCIAEGSFSRAQLGLPDSGFVFCCFNDNYKLTPETFSAWMRILNQVNGSVLFLYADNDIAVENLRREAGSRGIDPGRLVFGGRLPAPEYRARYRACDLFLDTLPYNAGTTASEALWAGLPVLTCAGEAMAGRVAASLLKAIGLPELVTYSRGEYEALAVALATEVDRLGDIRGELARNRDVAPLFDTPRFTALIEAAYCAMHERQRAGLPPGQIRVPAEIPTAAIGTLTGPLQKLKMIDFFAPPS